MYTEPRHHPHPQAESISAPDETSPLLSTSTKPAQPRSSWTLPDFLRATPKKKQDVEERSTGPGPENPEGGLSHRNETRDESASKNVSVKSIVAVLFFGIPSRTMIGMRMVVNHFSFLLMPAVPQELGSLLQTQLPSSPSRMKLAPTWADSKTPCGSWLLII